MAKRFPPGRWKKYAQKPGNIPEAFPPAKSAIAPVTTRVILDHELIKGSTSEQVDGQTQHQFCPGIINWKVPLSYLMTEAPEYCYGNLDPCEPVWQNSFILHNAQCDSGYQKTLIYCSGALVHSRSLVSGEQTNSRWWNPQAPGSTASAPPPVAYISGSFGGRSHGGAGEVRAPQYNFIVMHTGSKVTLTWVQDRTLPSRPTIKCGSPEPSYANPTGKFWPNSEFVTAPTYGYWATDLLPLSCSDERGCAFVVDNSTAPCSASWNLGPKAYLFNPGPNMENWSKGHEILPTPPPPAPPVFFPPKLPPA